MGYDNENYMITPHYYLNETSRLTEDYKSKKIKFTSRFDRVLGELFCISIINLEMWILSEHFENKN